MEMFGLITPAEGARTFMPFVLAQRSLNRKGLGCRRLIGEREPALFQSEKIKILALGWVNLQLQSALSQNG